MKEPVMVVGPVTNEERERALEYLIFETALELRQRDYVEAMARYEYARRGH